MTWLTINNIFLSYPVLFSLQCFDAVGWAAGRASGLKKNEWWGAGVVICLERGADLHMSQLMPLPLTVCCFGKIQIGFTSLVPAHPGSPRQRAIKWVCVCVLTLSTQYAERCLCNGWASVHLSVPHQSTVPSGFAAECPAGRRYWLMAAGASSQQQMQVALY